MYIDVVPNRRSRPAILLRESWREGKKICKRTVANITDWPAVQVEALRAVLRGEELVSPKDVFTIKRNLAHGHVRAVLGTMRKLGLPDLIDPKGSRQRNLVLAMIAWRVIDPGSKCSSVQTWKHSTLPDELAIRDADKNDLYDALDWLVKRQSKIEEKLARKHLSEGATVLYDLSSSFYWGATCPLVKYGHNRDGNRLPIIVYGVMTDRDGRPLASSVYPGNTADPATVSDQVKKLKHRFNLERAILVGDRGVLTHARIEDLKQYPGLTWISALRAPEIRKLAAGGMLQMSLFDEQHLAEISAPEDFPGERLIACYNPFLAADRKRTREELLADTEADLVRVSREAARRTKRPLSADEIGIRVGKVLNRHQVGKHFDIKIEAGQLLCSRDEESIRREAELDGVYVLRTSEPEDRLSADSVVRNYKNLSQVERAFRTMKGVDLLVRPIYHRLADHVRAHLFLCLLAYYVEWHLRQGLAPLLFADEELAVRRWQRDPVVPAEASASAKRKKGRAQTEDGLPVHSFKSLIKELGTQHRNQCVLKRNVKRGESPVVSLLTEPTPIQKRAFELLGINCTQ